MRKCRRVADEIVSKSVGGGRKANATTLRLANNPLAVPVIAKETPVIFAETSDRRLMAKVALEFLDAGEIPEDEKGDTPAVLKEALGRWAVKHAPMLDHRGFTLATSFDQTAIDYSDSYPDEINPDEWIFAIEAGEMQWYPVKAGIMALENAVKGLGETALNLIETAGYRTLDMFGPNRARDMCQYLYWYGMDTQEDYIEELKNYDEEDVLENLDDQLTPDSFDASFDDWVINATQVHDTEALARLETTEQVGFVRELLPLLRELDQWIKKEARLPSLRSECQNVYFGFCLEWEEDDPLSRIIDDHCEQANYASDSYTTLLVMEKAPSERQAFIQWKKGVEDGFALLSTLERLLTMIANYSEEK